MEKLHKSTEVTRVKTTNSAMRFLEANTPKVIVIPDHGIHDDGNRAILDKVVSYWVMGDYMSKVVWANVSCNIEDREMFAELLAGYHLKALYVHGPQPAEKIYVDPTDPFPENEETQAAVARAKVGEGYLVYIGDVNSGKEFDEIALKFCGIK
ncbi:uncharacterized protein PAC_11321 [Phialocephala subalpina]|uniref:Uncharacterized protein n=1 Tax=Phialocephala subalpina TaxID=576137 RepID=A0A1L7X8R3_9HELO|nr:uncharacterized protein PAC_11321 [Phialocephala subalpina]